MLCGCRKTLNTTFNLITSVRNSVTVSWPIKKGTDFRRWQTIYSKVLDACKVDVQYYEDTPQYRMTYNLSHNVTKDNVARLMGVDPKKFTNEEFRLSLMYLLPSDIQKPKYRPSIHSPMKVQSDIEALMASNKDDMNRPPNTEYFNEKKKIQVRERHRDLYDIIYDAEKKLKESPGLSSFINIEDGTVTLNETDNNCIKNRKLLQAKKWFRVFPFQPVNIDEATNMQFQELNRLIKNRPDLIQLYLPILENKRYIKTFKKSIKRKQEGKVSQTKFPVQATVMKSYYSVSAIVTVKVGSGKITVNGMSYLDYFSEPYARMIALGSLRQTDSWTVFDIDVEFQQENAFNSVTAAHCMSMCIAYCLSKYNKSWYYPLSVVKRKMSRIEYKKAGKKNSRRRYTWRKR